MPNSTHAPGDSAPLAATHPITGGSAPGTAPTTVANDERRLSGV
jgi:hypothetical protein